MISLVRSKCQKNDKTMDIDKIADDEDSDGRRDIENECLIFTLVDSKWELLSLEMRTQQFPTTDALYKSRLTSITHSALLSVQPQMRKYIVELSLLCVHIFTLQYVYFRCCWSVIEKSNSEPINETFLWSVTLTLKRVIKANSRSQPSSYQGVYEDYSHEQL